MQRGELWWAELTVPAGSEPGYRRPVLVVQASEFNQSQISTVVVATLTRNLRLAKAPGNVLLHADKARLDTDSVVNVSQILTLDKKFLAEPIGTLDHTTMRQVDEGLSLVLGL